MAAEALEYERITILKYKRMATEVLKHKRMTGA